MLLDVISVLQPHALLRSGKLVLDGNDHTTAANLHDNVVVARENGARDCSCTSTRDALECQRQLRVESVLSSSRSLVRARFEILDRYE